MVRALAVTAGNGFGAVPTAPAAGWILIGFGFAAALAVVAIAVFGCADGPKDSPRRKKDKRRRRREDGDGGGGDGGDGGGDGPDGGGDGARMLTAGITTMATDMAETMAADTTTMATGMAGTTAAAGTTITTGMAETMVEEAGTTMAETMAAAAGTTTPVTMGQAADSAVAAAAAAAAAGVVVVGSDVTGVNSATLVTQPGVSHSTHVVVLVLCLDEIPRKSVLKCESGKPYTRFTQVVIQIFKFEGVRRYSHRVHEYRDATRWLQGDKGGGGTRCTRAVRGGRGCGGPTRSLTARGGTRAREGTDRGRLDPALAVLAPTWRLRGCHAGRREVDDDAGRNGRRSTAASDGATHGDTGKSEHTGWLHVTRGDEPTARIRRRELDGGESRRRQLAGREEGNGDEVTRGRFPAVRASTRPWESDASVGLGGATPSEAGDERVLRSSSGDGGEHTASDGNGRGGAG
uniref:OSJNBb0022F16.5 protein n=1 Tax=Oryza sativa subsp. japonica TaxID=39947 RepID=Q7XTE0_ORYSJ|nr:OSJNBb0022F16.5 [Oryza sativa Japonica Group]